MKAYSIDMRQRVVAAYDAREGTHEQVAARFAVSVSWVRKLLRQRRATGSIGPRPHGGGHPPAFDAPADARLRQAVRDDSDATWRNSAASPAWRAASRPCSGRWTGWGSLGKKVAAGRRAGPPGPEGRVGGMASGVRRDRSGPARGCLAIGVVHTTRVDKPPLWTPYDLDQTPPRPQRQPSRDP